MSLSKKLTKPFFLLKILNKIKNFYEQRKLPNFCLFLLYFVQKRENEKSDYCLNIFEYFYQIYFQSCFGYKKKILNFFFENIYGKVTAYFGRGSVHVSCSAFTCQSLLKCKNKKTKKK